MSLTIDEAIARFEANAEQNERWASGGLNPEANVEYAAEHRQLAEWLRELQERRKAPKIVRCGECANQYKPTCPFGVWINTPDDGHCHWAERRTE